MLAIVTLALAAPQSVHVVGPPGVGAFTEIQPAIDFAQPGDIVLVHSGAYGGFVVQGKGLSIVADPTTGPRPQLSDRVLLRDLPTDARLVVTGFDVTEGAPEFGYLPGALSVIDCAGSVRAQDLSLRGGNGFEHSQVVDQAGSGAAVRGSGDVALIDCQLIGGSPLEGLGYAGGEQGEHGGDGLSVFENSRVAVQRCTLVGGDGQALPNGGVGGYGGGGIVVHNGGEVVVVHAAATGGDGGFGGHWLGLCASGGAGMTVDATGQASALATTFTPGMTTPGTGPGGCGPPVAPTYGNWTAWSGHARALQTPLVARSGEALVTRYFGQPGDLVARMASFDTDWRRRNAWRGVLLVERAGNSPLLLIGSIPGSGLLESPDAWFVPAALEGMTLHLQPLFRSSVDGTYLGNSASVAVLGAGF